MLDSVLVHVAPHQKRVYANKGQAVNRFIVSVGCHDQARRCLGVHGVGHLFHAANDHDIVQPTSHSRIAHAQRGCSRSAGSLYLDRLYATQSDEISDKRAQMLLAREQAREHVAHVQGTGRFDSGILHGCQHRIASQVSQRAIPMLSYLGLANADDAYIPHEDFPISAIVTSVSLGHRLPAGAGF